jgi:Activator of Hsp90 ATPase homolog 1-like protein
LLIRWGTPAQNGCPPGASLLEVRLHAADGGTTVTISLSGLPEPEVTGHREGWRHFLERLTAAAGQ